MRNQVSIIISSHNEAQNLHKNIPFILNQQNVDFELIIVDDGSDNNLAETLAISFKSNSGLRICSSTSDKIIESNEFDSIFITKLI